MDVRGFDGRLLASDCARWWFNEAVSDLGGVPRDGRPLPLPLLFTLTLAGCAGMSRLAPGWGRAPPGLLIRVLRRSARYAAVV